MTADAPVYVCFLNRYLPAWSDDLVSSVAESIPGSIQLRQVDLDLDRSYVPERRQYHATLMIAQLLRELPSPAAKIIGITSVDLFIPVLTFVFGQSQLDGHAAVVSTCRLHTEYYGLPPDSDLLLERSAKEVVHELGHAFGLVHCDDYRCVMKASTYVEEIDLKGVGFCDVCAGELLLKKKRAERPA